MIGWNRNHVLWSLSNGIPVKFDDTPLNHWFGAISGSDNSTVFLFSLIIIPRTLIANLSKNNNDMGRMG